MNFITLCLSEAFTSGVSFCSALRQPVLLMLSVYNGLPKTVGESPVISSFEEGWEGLFCIYVCE